jgi:hypothetical protein
VRSLNESDFQFKHTYNKAMEQTDFRTRRTPVRLAFADHMNHFIAGDSAPRTPERAEVLTRVDPTLDRAVVLLEHVIQIGDWPMPTILAQIAFGFELRDGGRVRAVTVGVDNAGHGMVLPSQRFDQEALGRGRVLLGREEKVEGRAGRIHRAIRVAPLALDPDVGLIQPANCRWSV